MTIGPDNIDLFNRLYFEVHEAEIRAALSRRPINFN